MGTNAYWKPTNIGKESFSIAVKQVLEKKFGHDFTLDSSNVEWLEGLVDAGIEGADDVIDKIYIHGAIDISISC